MERSTDEGDGSPARMTIAQAALLNLRGQELRPLNVGPVIHSQPSGVRIGGTATRGLGTSVSIPDFSSNAHHDISSGGGGTKELEVDYSLAPGRNMSAGGGIGHGQGSSPGIYPYQTHQSSNWSSHGPNQGHGHGQLPMDPTMVALLDSLRGNGVPYKAGESDFIQNQRSVGVGHHLHPLPHSLQHHNHLGASRSMGDISYSRPAPAYTRSGYTATEEYIMRAHADSAALAQAQAQAQYQQQQQKAAERRRPAPLDLRQHQRGDESQNESGATNIAVGLRGYRTQASIGRVGQEIIPPPISSSSSSQSVMGGMSSTMSEEDFHASAAAVRNEFRQQLRSLAGNCGGDESSRMAPSPLPTRHNFYIHPAHVNARLSREPSGQYHQRQQQLSNHQPPQQDQRPPLSPLLPSSSNNDSPDSNDDLVNHQHAATHMRSTTLPQLRSSSVRDSQQQQMHRTRGHYQHSSMSIPAQTLRTPQHASVSVMSGHSGADTSGVIYEGGHQQSQQQPSPLPQGANQQNTSHGSMDAGNAWTSSNSHSQSNLHHGNKSHFSSPNMYNDDPSSSSPSLISPTLTYSSQTPSTLSPATPFFGSFSNQAEGFEKSTGAGHGVNVHSLDQQQKNGASAT